MSTASILLDDLAQAWEDALREAPQEGDTFIYKSPIDGFYNVGTARRALRPDQYRILERAPKPKPEPQVVMASWTHDLDLREAYTLQPDGEWESIKYAVEPGDLVDPVPLVELPDRQALTDAILGVFHRDGRYSWPGATPLADAVLELLRGEA